MIFGVAFTQDEMSSGGVDYNYTRQAFPHQEAPGISVFARDSEARYSTPTRASVAVWRS